MNTAWGRSGTRRATHGSKRLWEKRSHGRGRQSQNPEEGGTQSQSDQRHPGRTAPESKTGSDTPPAHRGPRAHLARDSTRGDPGSWAGRGLARRAHRTRGQGRAGHGDTEAEAHTKSQPGRKEPAPPVRPATPDHRAPGTQRRAHTHAHTRGGPAPPRPTRRGPPGRATLTSCRQQKATSVQRPLHLPMAPGAARAVRRGALSLGSRGLLSSLCAPGAAGPGA